MVVNIVAIAFGLLSCFWGYKIFRVWLAIAGLFFGAMLGFYLGNLIGPTIWPIVGAIVIGLLACLLSYSLYKLGAVIIGAFIGALLAVMILSLFGVQPVWWASLIGAVIVAVMAAVFLKQFIIIGSAFQGSYMVVAGVYSLIVGVDHIGSAGAWDTINLPWYVSVVGIVLGIVTAIIQTKLEKKTPLKIDS